jgi:hypothetical protein
MCAGLLDGWQVLEQDALQDPALSNLSHCAPLMDGITEASGVSAAEYPHNDWESRWLRSGVVAHRRRNACDR